jgi:hypothetical protein
MVGRGCWISGLGPMPGLRFQMKRTGSSLPQFEAKPSFFHLTVLSGRAMHGWQMEMETKFLRLCKPATVGERIDGWRVCWIGGWDKCRVFFFVMVERAQPARSTRSPRRTMNA